MENGLEEKNAFAARPTFRSIDGIWSVVGEASSQLPGQEHDADGPDPRDWLAAIIKGSNDAIVSKNLSGIVRSWNPGATRLFGYSPPEIIGKSITILIPEDRLDEEPGILAQIESGKPVHHFDTVRKRKDGSLIDISLTISPIRNAKGIIVGASKIARDITERRLAQEEQQLLMGEMRHRVKNLFALASAIVSISAKSGVGAEDLTAAIQARLSSLARAHELTMSDWHEGVEDGKRVSLLALLETILTPYDAHEHVVIEGRDPLVRGKAVTSIALLFHELATNAAKYGALSVQGGRLNVLVSEGAAGMRLLWEETGGPAPSPGSHGFGSRLEKALSKAIGATIARDWRPAGLLVTISIPPSAFEA